MRRRRKRGIMMRRRRKREIMMMITKRRKGVRRRTVSNYPQLSQTSCIFRPFYIPAMLNSFLGSCTHSFPPRYVVFSRSGWKIER